MSDDGSPLALPEYVDWPIFPFEGELRVKAPMHMGSDLPRSGEPGGQPCRPCAEGDDAFIWVDDRWRVRARAEPSVVPVRLFLETRDHIDLDGLDDEGGAELGRMIVRLNRAIRAIDNVGRVQVYRWGDGAEHFHLWFYARPVGSMNLLGFGMPLWEPILPAIPASEWRANLATVAHALAADGGRAIVG
jgi:hypothetical protein